MWSVTPSTEYIEKRSEYEQKHPDALAYVLEKLQLFLTALNWGGKPSELKFKFLHPEGEGLLAIASSGKGKQVTRLYIFPEESSQIIHQLTLGDKRSQNADIRNCHETVKQIRSNQNGRDPDI